jgi:pimeloyl-ACP methyl ester carboxylesterase
MKKWLWIISLITFSLGAHAEEVKAKYHGKTVNANLMMADGKSYQDPFVLIVHGTLTHKGRSTYNGLQQLLSEEHQMSSLAINLSLGLEDREGEYPCETTHTHKHTDALAEIDFWVAWLKDKGVTQLTLVGHSRGGNQSAWFMQELNNPLVSRAVLIAPQTWNQQAEAADYEKKYGKPLQPLLEKAQQLVKAGKGDTVMKDVDFIYCKQTQVTAAAFANYYTPNDNFNTPTILMTAKKPTLVITGTEDKVVADLPAQMEKIDNPKVSHQTIEDADHFFLDFAAEDLASQVAEFAAQ